MSPKFQNLLSALGKLLLALPRTLYAHTKEVERTRYCKCCGALAGYYVTTAFCNMTSGELTIPSRESRGEKSLLIEDTPSLYLCLDHHPLIGKKRTETQAHLTHPKLEFHLIVPNPFK